MLLVWDLLLLGLFCSLSCFLHPFSVKHAQSGIIWSEDLFLDLDLYLAGDFSCLLILFINHFLGTEYSARKSKTSLPLLLNLAFCSFLSPSFSCHIQSLVMPSLMGQKKVNTYRCYMKLRPEEQRPWYNFFFIFLSVLLFMLDCFLFL